MSDGIVVNSQTTSTSTTNTYLIGGEASVFSISGLRLRRWPILATIGLGLLVVVPSGYVFHFLLAQQMSKAATVITMRMVSSRRSCSCTAGGPTPRAGTP